MTLQDPAHASGSPTSVLVILAHPDDPEFFCGGTLALWAAQGADVRYCLLTRGERGGGTTDLPPDELARVREAEQRAAAGILGVREVTFLDQPDGYLVADLALRKQVVRAVRRVRPQAVVTCDPSNLYPSDRYLNHPDHRAAGQAVVDAIFPAAGSERFFPELWTEERLAPHKVRWVYLALTQAPNVEIDVTATLDRKIAALREHRSQMEDPAQLEGRIRERSLDPGSPPEAPRFIERFRLIDLSGR